MTKCARWLKKACLLQSTWIAKNADACALISAIVASVSACLIPPEGIFKQTTSIEAMLYFLAIYFLMAHSRASGIASTRASSSVLRRSRATAAAAQLPRPESSTQTLGLMVVVIHFGFFLA
jgi:hypothetical protein